MNKQTELMAVRHIFHKDTLSELFRNIHDFGRFFFVSFLKIFFWTFQLHKDKCNCKNKKKKYRQFCFGLWCDLVRSFAWPLTDPLASFCVGISVLIFALLLSFLLRYCHGLPVSGFELELCPQKWPKCPKMTKKIQSVSYSFAVAEVFIGI